MSHAGRGQVSLGPGTPGPAQGLWVGGRACGGPWLPEDTVELAGGGGDAQWRVPGGCTWATGNQGPNGMKAPGGASGPWRE